MIREARTDGEQNARSTEAAKRGVAGGGRRIGPGALGGRRVAGSARAGVAASSAGPEATDLRVWGVKPHDGHFALQPLLQHREPIIPRGNALSNLCARLQVPVDFLRRLPAPLQLGVMNWSLGSLERAMPAALRLRGEEAAALVSDRYAPLDPEELVTTLRETLGEHGLLGEVRARAVATGLVDAVRITFPGRSVEPKVGDVTHAGLDISTSSFGRSALHVRGLLYRHRAMRRQAPARRGHQDQRRGGG